ncbi:MAG: multicopper oxidase family protein, partial [Hyphomicrobium sp.]
MVTRRELLVGTAAFSGSAAVGVFAVGRTSVEAREVIAEPIAHGVKSLSLDLAERPTALPCFGGKTLPLWTFESGTTFPIVRVKLGERLDTVFRNHLPRDGEV